RSPSPLQIAELSELSRRLAVSGRGASALKVAQWAVQHAELRRDAGLRVLALRARASAQGELSEHAACAQSLLEAQSLNLEIGDAKQELLLVTALGVAYGKLGIRSEAVAAHESALTLAAQCAPERLCEFYGNLGLALANSERGAEAIGFLRQALTLAERGQDVTSRLRARINLNAVRTAVAEGWLKRGDVEPARADLREIMADCEVVLADCRAAHAGQFIPPVIQHIGIVHKCLGEVTLARARFAYVTAMAREYGWQRLEFDALLHLAAMETDAGNFAIAENALARALGYFESARYRTSVLEAHLELSRLYERKGEFDRAYAALKKHHDIRLEIAANEERMIVQVRRWREEFDARRRKARESARAGVATIADGAGQPARKHALARQARCDPLTGLGNRHHGDAYVEQQFKLHSATNRVLAVALLDLDNLKAINDQHSHIVGDMVLRQVAMLLRGACRDSDMAIRFGGDEFLLVFPNTGAGQARAICERLRARMDKHSWRTPAPDLQVSVTIAVADSRGAHSPLDLLRAADARLYGEKETRRNRVA
ncbi:MAG: GGDEF domain-containing protein, partial [Casimicrobiaceae bacterium]